MSMGDKHAERAALLILKEAMPELTRQQASTIRGANPQRRNIRSHAWLTSDSTSDGWRKESARHGQERYPATNAKSVIRAAHAVCMKYEAYALARKVKTAHRADKPYRR